MGQRHLEAEGLGDLEHVGRATGELDDDGQDVESRARTAAFPAEVHDLPRELLVGRITEDRAVGLAIPRIPGGAVM